MFLQYWTLCVVKDKLNVSSVLNPACSLCICVLDLGTGSRDALNNLVNNYLSWWTFRYIINNNSISSNIWIHNTNYNIGHKLHTRLNALNKWTMQRLNLNWWKGKPSGSKVCTRKQQPRFYWSCSSVVMNDDTPLTPPSAWAELHFQM